MAILLKEQLRQISEGVHYSAPFINVLKKGRSDPKTLKASTQMFYDFYAMELMHRLLGSPRPDPDLNDPKYAGKLTPQQAAKLKAAVQKGGDYSMGAMYVKDWGDVEDIPAGVRMVPAALRKVIDQVYEEVTIALTKKMMAHLRLSLVQEFRYIVSHSHNWQSFRQRLVALHNKNGKVTKEEFEQAIVDKIPGMKGHTDAVKRLLKFSKHYASMSPDPADSMPSDNANAPKVGKPVDKKKDDEPFIDPDKLPEPDHKMPDSGEPDTTDYDAEPIEIPPGADWDDDAWKYYSSDVEAEKTKQWLKNKKGLDESSDHGYASGRISPHTILKVRQAINKSGLTWNDILLGYKNLDWGGAYGGPKWGEGVESFIKLLPHAKNQNVEDMAGIIDHIYDLEHNTGALLNKGGMFVDSGDLDRRAKVTSLARFLPNVSPLIKRLIIRVLPYVSKHPEIEQDITKVTQSPTVPMTAEESKILTGYKFVKSSTGDEWQTQAPYENKKGQTVQDAYTLKHHTNGMYSIQDSINADIQVFSTMDELKEWLDRHVNLFIMPQPGVGHYTAPKQMSAKDQYLSGKVKIKLDAAKETQLLDVCKLGWRPSNHYYKAYLPGSDRFQFFAFSDGTFMGCRKSTGQIGATFMDWPSAFEYCKHECANALPHQEYDECKAWIGKAINAPPPTPKVTATPSVGAAPQQSQTQFELSPIESQTLSILAGKSGHGVSVKFKVPPEGFTHFTITDGAGSPFSVLTIGKKSVIPTGKKYLVHHIVFGGMVESWEFNNWNQAYTFIQTNYQALTQGNNLVKGDVLTATTPSIFAQPTYGQLPPNSTSKNSYKVAVGIDKPPTHTIRLTAPDESIMTNIGFEPKMVGSDVWYIHKTHGDTVKFFPNDTAKILFIKTNSKVMVTKKIDDALAWLKEKYSATGGVSPIVQQQAAAQTGPKGSKAGAMFEKILSDAGFQWDAASGKYVQSDTKDTIEIRPFPISTFTSNSGETKKFNSLPELAAYVKNYANGVKKK